jgi:hypothetical protein
MKMTITDFRIKMPRNRPISASRDPNLSKPSQWVKSTRIMPFLETWVCPVLKSACDRIGMS